MHTTGIGIQEMDSALNAIDKDIKAVQANLNKYEKSEKFFVESIDKAVAQKEKNHKNTLGQILPPTQEDLEKDKIARARASNILILYKIALNYKDLSYVPIVNLDTVVSASAPTEGIASTESFVNRRKYPDEAKLPRQLKVLRQIFWAHANAPGLQFDRKDELTFDDPATTENLNILRAATQEGRATSANSKISLDIDAYVKQVSTIANDPLVSDGIERKPDATLPLSNSLSEKTKSYPASVLRVGDFYLGSFEIPTFNDCINKWWAKKNELLYGGLPRCPGVVEPYPTTGDVKTEEYNAATSEAVIAGTAKYKKELTKAKATIEEEKEKNIGDLPSDAPDWVKVYAETYGSSSRGSLDYEGSQIVVGRGTGTTQDESLVNASKLVTFPPNSAVNQKGIYTYLSLTGYLVTFTNNRTLFVYPENKENFDNNPGPVAVKSIEEQNEWVSYVQWG